jgi:hypothetical protein
MAGCFQLDTIDHSAPTPPAPPVIRYESLRPEIDAVVMVRLPEPGETMPPAVFYMPYLFDANGFETDDLHGRWFVNYDPATTVAPNVFADIKRKPAPEETDAGTTEDDCPCEGCCWEARFNVPDYVFREGTGCYQILALISDSEFKSIQGELHLTENENTIPAEAIWWVWAYRGEDPVSPAFDTCAKNVEANP